MSSAPHWSLQRERGSLSGMRIVGWLLQHVGRRWVQPLVWLVLLYFYLSGRRARAHVRQYQTRLAAFAQEPALRPTVRSVWGQFHAFAQAMLDRLDAWQGRISYSDLELDDPDQVSAQMGHGRGQMMVCAHLGNPDVCRALAQRRGHVRVNVLVHSRHAERFNRLLAEVGADHFRLLQISELDPSTLILLRQRLDAGEWLAIAADRLPLDSLRAVQVDFLGAPAHLPQGPWLLAGLLACPVNLFHCTAQGHGRYRVRFERLSAGVSWTRAQRSAVVQELAQRYANSLAQACVRTPWQWFNFYDFWRPHDAQATSERRS